MQVWKRSDLKGGHKMSTIATLLRRLFTALLEQDPAPVDPDTMSLHDWADLPPHHPAGDRAPC
jgi:hypothetical protein